MHTDKLSALARRQRGVFSRGQALELGYSHEAVTRRLKRGEWRVAMGNVLTAAGTELDRHGWHWAGYLAAGPGAVLSGPSAAIRHGLEVTENAVWVTVPAERHTAFRGLRTIRESLPPNDVIRIEHMRVTSLERTIVDCLRVLPVPTVQPLLDRAIQRGWLTAEQLTARTVQFAGRRGVTNLRAHVNQVQAGAHSEAERLAQKILTDAGIDGWVANLEVCDRDGVVRAILDIAFKNERVALEIDGAAHHSDASQFQRDRTRQNWLVNRGWTVLRFTWHDLTRRPAYVVATVRAALGRQDRSHR